VSDGEQTVKAAEVRVGQRIRSRGIELTVTRIDEAFLGRPEMYAFVEDSDEQWIKVPAAADADVTLLGP
jgi:hypothetical protein